MTNLHQPPEPLHIKLNFSYMARRSAPKEVHDRLWRAIATSLSDFISGGMNERYDASIQLAPEPASKEEEVMNGARDATERR